MTQEMKYENWFAIHSGLKKPILTKGGFLSVVGSELNKVKSEVKETKPAPKKEEKKEEKGTTNYEKWFYRNCDNNNEPNLAEINSHDYEAWFLRHSTKRAPEPKYASPYEAWFFRNCDNSLMNMIMILGLKSIVLRLNLYLVIKAMQLGLKEIVIQEILVLCLHLF